MRDSKERQAEHARHCVTIKGQQLCETFGRCSCSVSIYTRGLLISCVHCMVAYRTCSDCIYWLRVVTFSAACLSKVPQLRTVHDKPGRVVA